MPDVILLAHGAAIVDPEHAQYMLDHTGCHGVQLGSSIERMAVEGPIEVRAAAFKAGRLPCRTRLGLRRCRSFHSATSWPMRRAAATRSAISRAGALESLLAVADAAAAERSPVILGFSGIYLPHPAAG